MSLLPAILFFNDTATTEIYTLSLHDALPISPAYPQRIYAPSERIAALIVAVADGKSRNWSPTRRRPADRKSTRLNSSHANISYAVFCLKNKTLLKSIHSHSFSAYLFFRIKFR